MALPVAIQSVVFYYLACTPCMSARTRYRAKKKFDRERKEREALEEDEPPLYRHPSPFSVNPYWQEEIMMGPSLPKKGRAARQNLSQRKLTSAGQDGSIATRSSLAISSHGGPSNTAGGGGIWQGGPSSGKARVPGEGTGTAAATTSVATNAATTAVDSSSTDDVNNANGNFRTHTTSGQPPASPTLIPDDARSMSLLEMTATSVTVASTTNGSTEGWNFKRYQREDEELWGAEPSSRTHKLMDAIAKASSSAGRLIESTLGTKERSSSLTSGSAGVTDRDRANFYATTVIHPPVNDYHPPVVSSKPAHRDGLRWMLQPPPPAKIMEGKVPVSRSTSVASSKTSGAPCRSTAAGSEVLLTRRKALEARLRRADSGRSNVTVAGRPHTSSLSSIDDDAAEAAAYAAATASLSRNVSRKSAGGQPKRVNLSYGASAANRSRSGSLASSIDDPNWSSDEEGVLRTRWRFPTSVPLPMPAVPATAALPGTAYPKNTEGVLASRSSLHLNSRPKLETILSSDASGKTELGRVGDSEKNSLRKENARPIPTTAVRSDDSYKTPHDGSLGSSLDSGLALTS
ncbi:MAG: hypothetical protein SEPTF4163_004205 [Sporothrix epigloea]